MFKQEATMNLGAETTMISVFLRHDFAPLGD